VKVRQRVSVSVHDKLSLKVRAALYPPIFSMLIIIKGKHRLGKTRSEIENNLHKEWGTAALSQEQIDKCKHVEKKTGLKWVDGENIAKIK
jgi:hypothetical protein